MSPDDIYAKTEAGLAEIRARRLNLSVALRSVLIMIDGKRTAGDIIERTRTLRVDLDTFRALEADGLVALRTARPDHTPARTAAEPAPVAVLEDDVQRYLVAQKLISDAVSKHLGLRGYGLMLRLQRTSTLGDLRELLPDLAKALVKRLGLDAATSVVVAIERALGPA